MRDVFSFGSFVHETATHGGPLINRCHVRPAVLTLAPIAAKNRSEALIIFRPLGIAFGEPVAFDLGGLVPRALDLGDPSDLRTRPC